MLGPRKPRVGGWFGWGVGRAWVVTLLLVGCSLLVLALTPIFAPVDGVPRWPRVDSGVKRGLPEEYSPLRDVLVFLRMQKTGSTSLVKMLVPLVQQLELAHVREECEQLCGAGEVGDKVRCNGCEGEVRECVDVSEWCCNNMGPKSNMVNTAHGHADCWSRLGGCLPTPGSWWVSASPPCPVLSRMHADSLDVGVGLDERALDPERIRVLTVVRDPVARVVSEYRHVLRNWKTTGDSMTWDYAPGNTLPGKAIGSIEDFLDCAECAAGTSNRQARMLAGVGRGDVDVKYKSSAQLAAAAIVALNDMIFVGVTERMQDEGYALLAAILGTELQQPVQRWIPQEDVNDPDLQFSVQDLSPQTRDRILQMNAADVAVHSYAKQRFQSLLNAAKAHPKVAERLRKSMAQ